MPISAFKRVTPTSVVAAGSGSSATIGEHGKVTFSSCTSLSLNGIFTSAYDNYIITIRADLTGVSLAQLDFCLRLSGTDNTTASSYVTQTLQVDAITLTASRITAAKGGISQVSKDNKDGITMYLFAPRLAQATAWRATSVCGRSGAQVYDYAGTHNQATGYDGITLIPASNTIAGLLTVYGCNQ